jgi:hypothetical protein
MCNEAVHQAFHISKQPEYVRRDLPAVNAGIFPAPIQHWCRVAWKNRSPSGILELRVENKTLCNRHDDLKTCWACFLRKTSVSFLKSE